MSIILVNDHLHGILGEKKVLWNYMLDYIPNLYGVDIKTMKRNKLFNNNINFVSNVAKYIRIKHPNCKLIIQNGTFFPLIPLPIKKMILIQDNLRKMGRKKKIQDRNFKNADYVITNGKETSAYYCERDTTQIPLGVDDTLFTPLVLPKKDLRNTLGLPNDNRAIGIFIGSLSPVKGWNIMQKVIQRRKDIFWIIVTKYNEIFRAPNCVLYSRIKQELLVKLSCAADFFILPSPAETQCLAAIEAALCGTPIMMRNTGFIQELTDEEKKHIGVITNDFSDEDIDKILNNSYNTRQIVKDKYSISKMIDHWNNIITEVLSK